jgi:RNA polymerase sigma factor (sigma-70 family)
VRPSNTELVRGCLAGEEAAWRTLILGYERLIYSIPVGYGMGTDEADDIFQAVCVALMESLPSLRDPERLGQWLVVTTRRMCWERWRRNRREESLPGNATQKLSSAYTRKPRRFWPHSTSCPADASTFSGACSLNLSRPLIASWPRSWACHKTASGRRACAA